MNKLKWALLFLIIDTTAFAQFQVSDTKDPLTGEDFPFPKLKSTQHPEVAKKINERLQKSELGSILIASDGDPFSGLKVEDVYEYNVQCNNDKVFSLGISTGHNGAGSHFQFRDYSFDARTGDPINLNNLLSTTGQVKIKKTLYKIWKESVKASINDEYFADEYKECLASANGISELPVDRMIVTPDGINIMGGSCLDGSSWNEDRTRGPHSVSYKQMLSMLTPYGLSLFIGPPVSPSSLRQNLLKGKIDGKYSVTLFFESSNSAGKLSGTLVYDSFDSPITIAGTLLDNDVKFNEMDNTNSPVSEFVSVWNGKTLTGTFKNLKTGKVMSFVASRL